MTQRIHVCLLTSGRIFDLAYGGVEKFTISLGRWLPKQSYDVTLMGSGFASVKAKRWSEFVAESDNKRRTHQKQIRVLYPRYSIYLLSRFVLSVLWVSKILSIHAKSPITIIHAQDTGYAGLAAIVSGKILRIPVILSSHGIRHKTLEPILQGRFKKFFLKIEYAVDIFTTKRATGVIAVSPAIKQYFELLTSREIAFIPIPIKLKDFQFSEINRDLVRKELGIDKKAKVIGFVGRFSYEKNIFTLLVSFANIAHDNYSLKLLLVGASGPLESKIKEYISKRKLEDRVILCGIRYDIDKVLSSFDIFVLPSYTEGLSTALLEAMACSRAIICSDIPANRELVIHNKEALLVNPYSTEAFEEAIQLLSNDDFLRIRLGQNARIKANQYDEETVFPEVLRYYEAVSRKSNWQ